MNIYQHVQNKKKHSQCLPFPFLVPLTSSKLAHVELWPSATHKRHVTHVVMSLFPIMNADRMAEVVLQKDANTAD